MKQLHVPVPENLTASYLVPLPAAVTGAEALADLMTALAASAGRNDNDRYRSGRFAASGLFSWAECLELAGAAGAPEGGGAAVEPEGVLYEAFEYAYGCGSGA